MRSRIRIFVFLCTSLIPFGCAGIEPPDSLCSTLLRSLPDFPSIRTLYSDTVFFSFSELSGKEHTPPLFIVVTNRELIRGKNQLEYSNNCQSDLSYVAVYREADQYRLIRLGNLQEAIQLLPDTRETLLYVHGYGRTFTNTLNESELIRRFYNVSLIVFDWPSKYPGIFELKSYLYAKQNIERSLPQFRTFLMEYAQCRSGFPEFGSEKSVLLLHSMGNAFLEKMYHQKRSKDIDQMLFDIVLMNAPAVKITGHRKWVNKMDLSDQVVILTNHKDPTLYGVFWLTLRKQLGRYRQSKNEGEIRYINLGNIAQRHHNYFINEELMQTYPSLKILYFSLIARLEKDKVEECRLINIAN